MNQLLAQVSQGVWKPLIVCDTNCNYNDLITLAQNVINNLIVLSSLFATAAFMYAGFKLMTSGGSTSAKEDAKKLFWKVVWGFAWILAAWIVVYTITSVLLKPDYNTILGSPQS